MNSGKVCISQAKKELTIHFMSYDHAEYFYNWLKKNEYLIASWRLTIEKERRNPEELYGHEITLIKSLDEIYSLIYEFRMIFDRFEKNCEEKFIKYLSSGQSR